MIPELEDTVEDGCSINGIGGKQKTGDPVQCDVTFHSGWTQTHWLKPTFLPSQPELVILGTDFMQKFGKTGFDWEKGRVKLGEQWVYCLLSEDKQPNYNINPELSTEERNMDAIVKNAKKNMSKEQTQDGSGLDDYSDNLILFSRNLEDHKRCNSSGVQLKRKLSQC